MAVFRAEYKFSGKLATLRSAELGDAGALLDLARRLDGQAVSLGGGTYALGEPEARASAFISSRRDMPNGRLAVAELAGRIAAAADALFPGGNSHLGEMTLAVDAAHWHIGIARALLEENIAWFRLNGIQKVNMSIDTQNVSAVSLCHHVGFVVEGRQERWRKRGDGAFCDAYWMGLKLE